MTELLDKIDDLETLSINKIQKTCCDDCQHAATRSVEELTTGLRRALRQTVRPSLPFTENAIPKTITKGL